MVMNGFYLKNPSEWKPDDLYILTQRVYVAFAEYGGVTMHYVHTQQAKLWGVGEGHFVKTGL